MYCTQLVSKVSNHGGSTIFIALTSLRCMAKHKELDSVALYRCKEHTDLLVEDIDFGVLWDEYGIVGGLVVRYLLT